MKHIDYIIVGLYDDETDGESQVKLYYDSGNDEWPDEPLPKELENRLMKISELAYNPQTFQNWVEEYKGKLVFESPDGGNTIYYREFGDEPSERKLLTNQLNLFSK